MHVRREGRGERVSKITSVVMTNLGDRPSGTATGEGGRYGAPSEECGVALVTRGNGEIRGDGP